MSYYKFEDGDIIDTVFKTYPSYQVSFNGNVVTGSVYLEKPFLDSAMESRMFEGYSQRQGGLINRQGPFTASLDFYTAISGADNNELWHSVTNVLSDYYKVIDSNYNSNYTGSLSTTIRVISIPEIYFDSQILSGSLTASAKDSAGDMIYLYDNGRGGIYSGSLTGTLVGNVYYSEGLIILKKGDLSNFGEDSPDNDKWSFCFKGIHNIPCKIFKCHAPAGQLNASTNETFYQIPTTGDYKNQKQKIFDKNFVYVTQIGLFNEQYELVAIANLATPIRKDINQGILFKIKLDW